MNESMNLIKQSLLTRDFVLYRDIAHVISANQNKDGADVS